MTVRDEIDKFSADSDKPVLHCLLNKYHWDSKWSFVAKCEHVRYGILSYQTNRVWSPTDEGLILYQHNLTSTTES